MGTQHKIQGLSQHEVDKQIQKGNVNKIPQEKTVSSLRIILGHTFNLFNLYNVIIAGFLIYVGEYMSVFFLNVILMNIGIRSFQEIRSKKIVENLNILISQNTTVIRDGEAQYIPGEELVLGDVVLYQLGDQISADAIIVSGQVEMNESNLTGESVPILKKDGDTILSGSFVTSGRCYARTHRVGVDSYAQKITVEARNYQPVQSELMETFLKITRICTHIVLPIGIILVFQSMVLRGEPFRATVLNTSSVLLGLLPKGLILLTSLSFGVSVFRLAKKRTLVQEIYSIEVLSKVDVLCIDKTGTLTAGLMSVEAVTYLEKGQLVDTAMHHYLSSSQDTDSTTQAMKRYFDIEDDMQADQSISFSSARKWGAMSFKDFGTVMLGAPEFLMPGCEIPTSVIQHQNDGARVLLVAFSNQMIENDSIPSDRRAIAFIIINDPVREDVEDALEFFKNNEVNVKVISGDNIHTLTAVAKRTGIENGDQAIDVSGIETDEELEAAVLNYNVIGRASPYQKQKMVAMLQKNNKRVAMVGDGVNDVLALRTADCSIAMGSGSSAARQAGQIILLDNEFTTMVDVVMEGRLVTNNISKSASMYYLGTLLTFMLAVVSIVMNTHYPFTPIQGSIMSMFVEGFPSSFITFESNYTKPKGDIIINILKNILPNALMMSLMFMIILNLPYPMPHRTTMMYFVTIGLSLELVTHLFQPMNWKRIGIFAISLSALIAIVTLFPQYLYLVRLGKEDIILTGGLILLSQILLIFMKKGVSLYFEKRTHRKKKK